MAVGGVTLVIKLTNIHDRYLAPRPGKNIKNILGIYIAFLNPCGIIDPWTMLPWMARNDASFIEGIVSSSPLPPPGGGPPSSISPVL
jgi:hypothetical protein